MDPTKLQGLKLTELHFEDWLGVETRHVVLGPGANLVTGDVATGKSALLKGVDALFTGLGVSKDSIRVGADKCILFAKTETLEMQQVIRRSGNNEFTVWEHGMGGRNEWKRSRERMKAIVGKLVNPMRLYSADAAERRAMILEVIQAPVTTQDAIDWTGEALEVPDGVNGFDIVKLWRERFDDQRYKANRSVEEAEAEFKVAQKRAQELASEKHAGVSVPLPGEEDAPIQAAQRELDGLAQRQRQAEEQVRRTSETREKIATLRREADAIVTSPYSEESLAGIREEALAAQAEVVRATAALREAERVRDRRKQEWQDAINHNKAAAEEEKIRANKISQADALAESLASVAIAPVTEDERMAAVTKLAEAQTHAQLVREVRAAHDASVDAAELGSVLESAQAEAKRLDDIIKRLDGVALTELGKRAKLPEGLVIEGKRITLDGVALDNLSGAESRRFAVKLAKRISPVPFFLVDGLESLGKHVPEFVREVTEGGYQLLGTQVTDGELKVVAIELDDEKTSVAPVAQEPASPRAKVVMADETNPGDGEGNG